jgi:hypothetical protein
MAELRWPRPSVSDFQGRFIVIVAQQSSVFGVVIEVVAGGSGKKTQQTRAQAGNSNTRRLMV